MGIRMMAFHVMYVCMCGDEESWNISIGKCDGMWWNVMGWDVIRYDLYTKEACIGNK